MHKESRAPKRVAREFLRTNIERAKKHYRYRHHPRYRRGLKVRHGSNVFEGKAGHVLRVAGQIVAPEEFEPERYLGVLSQRQPQPLSSRDTISLGVKSPQEQTSILATQTCPMAKAVGLLGLIQCDILSCTRWHRMCLGDITVIKPTFLRPTSPMLGQPP